MSTIDRETATQGQHHKRDQRPPGPARFPDHLSVEVGRSVLQAPAHPSDGNYAEREEHPKCGQGETEAAAVRVELSRERVVRSSGHGRGSRRRDLRSWGNAILSVATGQRFSEASLGPDSKCTRTRLSVVTAFSRFDPANARLAEFVSKAGEI